MSPHANRSQAIRGTSIELFAYGGEQLLRLASTLVLTRLLFPEAFGIAAILSVLFIGLSMLSDAGLQQSVVQNVRGDDIAFLNTIWTIQVIRGIGLWLLACLTAWPIAIIYENPAFIGWIAFGATSLIVSGFCSTSVLTLRRHVNVAPLAAIEISSQFCGLVCTIILAYVTGSVWSIVVGTVIQSTTRTIFSHVVSVGYHNRPQWDSAASKEIFRYGRWILGSSALAFFSRQSDRLLIGYFAGMGTLGIYNLAVMLSEAIGMAVARITHGVIFPLLSRVNREKPDRMGGTIYRVRLFTDPLGLIPLGALAMLSHLLIELMYDERYAAAGWMLQILCIRVAMAVLLSPHQTCLFALGFTQYGFYQHASKSLWLLLGIPVGWYLGGMKGIVWATALCEIPVLLLLWHQMHKRGLLQLWRELLGVGFLCVGLLFGILLKIGACRASTAFSLSCQ